MKELNKEFLRKAQFPLTIAFALNPIPLLSCVSLAPGILPFFWVIPVTYVLLALFSFRVPGKYRLLYGIGGCVLMAGLGLALLQLESTLLALVTLLTPAAYCVALMMSLPIAGWTPDKELSPVWYYTGIILHAATFCFKFFQKALNNFDWDRIDPWLLLSFFSMVILVLLSLTRLNLNSSANGRQKPTAFMWQKNITLTVAFFAIAVLISLVPGIYNVISSFFAWLGQTFKDFLDSIEIEQIVNDLGDGQATPPPDSGEPVEESILVTILNIIYYIFVGGILTAVAIPTGKYIIKTVRRLYNRLISGVTSYVSEASEDYEDEVTDLRSNASREKKIRLSSSEERNLPPDQRIRYRYRRLLSRHPDWEHGSTARENLPADAAPYYEKARYSDHPITEDDAANFTSHTRRV